MCFKGKQFFFREEYSNNSSVSKKAGIVYDSKASPYSETLNKYSDVNKYNNLVNPTGLYSFKGHKISPELYQKMLTSSHFSESEQMVISCLYYGLDSDYIVKQLKDKENRDELLSKIRSDIAFVSENYSFLLNIDLNEDIGKYVYIVLFLKIPSNVINKLDRKVIISMYALILKKLKNEIMHAFLDDENNNDKNKIIEEEKEAETMKEVVEGKEALQMQGVDDLRENLRSKLLAKKSKLVSAKEQKEKKKKKSAILSTDVAVFSNYSLEKIKDKIRSDLSKGSIRKL